MDGTTMDGWGGEQVQCRQPSNPGPQWKALPSSSPSHPPVSTAEPHRAWQMLENHTEADS